MTASTTSDTRAILARGLGKRYRVRRARSRSPSGDADPAEQDGRSEKGSRWFWALRHVDFQVRRGEIFGVIGRNGSGKTTLLKILAGVTSPTGGSAEMRGRVTALLQVGAGFHPQLTGRDNIALNGAIMGLSANEVRERFDEIVAFSEIGRFLDEPVKHYSSGMYARLAFSVSAFLPAEIMLVDEILAVGDAAFKEKAEARMSETLNDGRAVVYVGHDIAFVRSNCEHALVLDAGRVVYDGAANAAADYYRDEIVRRRPGSAR